MAWGVGRARRAVGVVRDYTDPRRAALRWHTRRVVRAHRTHPWHATLPWERPYVETSLAWLRWDAPRHARVLDAGCGLGHLLLALERSGFTDLRGVDVEEPVVLAARDFLRAMGSSIRVEREDAFAAIPVRAPIDALVTTNWHHAVKDGLPRLVEAASRSLAPGGVWIFDALDPPVKDREAFARSDVEAALQKSGLRPSRVASFEGRTLYEATYI